MDRSKEIVNILKRVEAKVEDLRTAPELPVDIDEQIKKVQQDLNLIWEYMGVKND